MRSRATYEQLALLSRQATLFGPLPLAVTRREFNHVFASQELSVVFAVNVDAAATRRNHRWERFDGDVWL